MHLFSSFFDSAFAKAESTKPLHPPSKHSPSIQQKDILTSLLMSPRLFKSSNLKQSIKLSSHRDLTLHSKSIPSFIFKQFNHTHQNMLQPTLRMVPLKFTRKQKRSSTCASNKSSTERKTRSSTEKYAVLVRFGQRYEAEKNIALKNVHSVLYLSPVMDQSVPTSKT